MQSYVTSHNSGFLEEKKRAINKIKKVDSARICALVALPAGYRTQEGYFINKKKG